jgi:hypothetical protein
MHGVHLYLRYRDDILVVYIRSSTGPNGVDFMRKLKSLASCTYKIECETVSQQVPFLDLNIYMSSSFSSTGKLSFKPHIKCTAQKTPLSHLSLHPLHVHSAWPLAEVGRLYRRSSNMAVFECARAEFVHRMLSIFMHPSIIKKNQELVSQGIQTQGAVKQHHLHCGSIHSTSLWSRSAAQDTLGQLVLCEF